MASTRRFSDGLRALVVNYNSAWLSDIEATLRRCNYEGTIFCGPYEKALDLLKEKKHVFDAVLCGLNNRNNGAEEFEFLERVAREFDLPVTCAISNEEDVVAMVMKYARYTVNFVVGPATEKDLMAIWQHKYRKMLSKASAANNIKDDDGLGNNDNTTALVVVEEENDQPTVTATTTCNRQEKQKLTWTEELLREFVGGVERTRVPLDKVTPKQILKEMNIPGITRDQIASRLQKYRKWVKEQAAIKNPQQNVATDVASTSSAPPRNHREYDDAPINGQQRQIVANQDYCAQQIVNQYPHQLNQESARLSDYAPPSLYLPDQVINQESALQIDCAQQIVKYPQVNQARLLDRCAPSRVHLPDQLINQESALHLDCAQQIVSRHPQAVNQESAHRSDCAPQMMEFPQLIDAQQFVHLPDLAEEHFAPISDYAQQMADLPQLIDQESIGSLGYCDQEMMCLSDLLGQESAPRFDYAQQMRDLPQLIEQGSMRCLGCGQQITHFPYLVVDQQGSLCFSCAQQIMHFPPQEVNQESENRLDRAQPYPPQEVNQESANHLACDRQDEQHASSSSSRFYATCS